VIGNKVAHFRIIDKIGEGGMGAVYRAEDEKLGRQIALKVLPADFAGNEERRLRFIREARTAAALSHPNIATIHQILEEGDGIYIAMELLEGKTLADRIGGKPLPVDELLRLAVGICEGLSKAHKAGVMHRDLKPDNVKLSDEGHPKILDFGLAKLFEGEGAIDTGDSRSPTVSMNVTREGRIMGTVAYMSPEQARGLKLDARSDVFSFGVVLYEMATGRAPFEGATITDTLSAILRDPPAPIVEANPEAPAELERIIARCLEKEPQDRYQSTEDLLIDLRNLKRASDSHSVSLPRVSAPDLAPLGASRRWGRALLVGAAALALVGLVWLAPRLSGERSAAGGSTALQSDSLAVMPFQNMQEAGEFDRIGQIIQELVITDLSDIGSLRVLSSQRLFDLQKQLGRDGRATIERDIASRVARLAGAGTMLTGSVSRLGDNWIVTSQLVNVADGTVVKSERIDGSDLYAMVDDLTRRIRGNMGIAQLASASGDVAIQQRTSSSLAAYQHYLAGSERLNELHFDTAIDELRKAVEIDPDFGQAYYKLAIAEWWQRGLEVPKGESGPDSPEKVLERLGSGQLKASEKYRMLARASLALVEARFDDAAGLFREVVDAYPDEKEAWYGLGESLFHSMDEERRAEALEAFEQSLNLDPSFTVSYRHVFDLYRAQQRYDDIIRRARTLIESKPDDTQFYAYWLGGAIAKGDDAQTAEALRQGIEHARSPKDTAELYLEAGRAYQEIGDFNNALLYSGKSLEAGEDAPRGARELFGYAAVLTGHLDEAERAFEKAAEAEKPMPAVWGGRALVAFYRKAWDTGFRYCNRWLEAAPQNLDAVAGVLSMYLRRGDKQAATKLLEDKLGEAEEDWRKRELYRRAALVYLRAGEFARAEELARHGSGQGEHGKSADSAHTLGAALAYQGKLDLARSVLTAALRNDPNDVDLQARMAELEFLEGRPRQAETQLRAMLERGPAHRGIRSGLAIVLSELGEYAEAEQQARKALAMDPAGSTSRTILAWVLIAGNRGLDEGLRLAEEAREKGPDFDGPPPVSFIPSPEHCIGLAHLKRGEYREAARVLEEAAKLRPDRRRIRDDLAEARARLG